MNTDCDKMQKEIGRLLVNEIKEGKAYSLKIPENKDDLEVIVVKYSGNVRAWINSCPHDGRPLCRDPEYVWDTSGKFLECMNHQALFDPKTGMCTDGPCTGDSLFRIDVSQEGREIILRI